MHTHKYLFSSWACPSILSVSFWTWKNARKKLTFLNLSHVLKFEWGGARAPNKLIKLLKDFDLTLFSCHFWMILISIHANLDAWMLFQHGATAWHSPCVLSQGAREHRHIATDKVATFDLIFLEKRTTAALMLPKIGTFESKLRYKTAPHSAGSCCKNFPLGRTLQRKIIVF